MYFINNETFEYNPHLALFREDINAFFFLFISKNQDEVVNYLQSSFRKKLSVWWYGQPFYLLKPEIQTKQIVTPNDSNCFKVLNSIDKVIHHLWLSLKYGQISVAKIICYTNQILQHNLSLAKNNPGYMNSFIKTLQKPLSDEQEKIIINFLETFDTLEPIVNAKRNISIEEQMQDLFSLTFSDEKAKYFEEIFENHKSFIMPTLSADKKGIWPLDKIFTIISLMGYLLKNNFTTKQLEIMYLTKNGQNKGNIKELKAAANSVKSMTACNLSPEMVTQILGNKLNGRTILKSYIANYFEMIEIGKTNPDIFEIFDAIGGDLKQRSEFALKYYKKYPERKDRPYALKQLNSMSKTSSGSLNLEAALTYFEQYLNKEDMLYTLEQVVSMCSYDTGHLNLEEAVNYFKEYPKAIDRPYSLEEIVLMCSRGSGYLNLQAAVKYYKKYLDPKEGSMPFTLNQVAAMCKWPAGHKNLEAAEEYYKKYPVEEGRPFTLKKVVSICSRESGHLYLQAELKPKLRPFDKTDKLSPHNVEFFPSSPKMETRKSDNKRLLGEDGKTSTNSKKQKSLENVNFSKLPSITEIFSTKSESDESNFTLTPIKNSQKI